jgi:hypothetical protein
LLGVGLLGVGLTGVGLGTTTTNLELANLTVADLPAASLTATVAVLRDELTLAVAGLTEMEETLRYIAGAETSDTWLTPILAVKTPHEPLKDTTLPFRAKRNAPGATSQILTVGLMALFAVAPALAAVPATKALLPMAKIGTSSSIKAECLRV